MFFSRRGFGRVILIPERFWLVVTSLKGDNFLFIGAKIIV